VSVFLVKVKEKFSFQQGLSGKTVCLITDSCQHMIKLNLAALVHIDGDVIQVINKLGNQLTTLVLYGRGLTCCVFVPQ